MDSTAAGDVDDVEHVEEAGALPEPMGRDTVHDGVDQREEAVGVEIAPSRRDSVNKIKLK